MDEWYLYLVRTRHGTLYTGITTDVTRRLTEHADGSRTGAKYLRSKGPLQLVYQAKIGTRALALRAEHGVKKMPKQKKEQIVSTRPGGEALLELLGLRCRTHALDLADEKAGGCC